MKRDLSLDLLKIIAIFAVVAVHTQRCLATGELYNPVVYYFFRFAMPLFVMCNGYLILNKDHYDFKYYKKKILRIIVLLVTWGLVTFVYQLTLCHSPLPQAAYCGFKCTLGAYIVPFWFLFSFGLIYTILLFSFDKVKKYSKQIIIGLAICMTIVDIISLINIFHGGYFIQWYVTQRLRLWTWMFYFVVGYKIKTSMHVFDKVKTPVLVVLFLVLSVMAVLYQYNLCAVYLGKINAEYCYDNAIIILWSISFFILINRIDWEKCSDKVKRAISVVVENCFGVFLIHSYIDHYFNFTGRVSNAFESTILWLSVFTFCLVVTYFLRKIKYVGRMFEY